jgi:hypothetical protein
MAFRVLVAVRIALEPHFLMRPIEDDAQMDATILSATYALVGSLIGGASTLTASWFTQHGQLRLQALVHEAAKREALYAEFISEASRRFTEAWATEPKALKFSPVSTPRCNECG